MTNNSRIRLFIALLSVISASLIQAQSKKALFLGNSYTAYNNLASLTAAVATSMEDTLIVDSNTPGGYTLEGHSTNANTLSKIMQGDWDFVTLQEQSQRPSFPFGQVASDVFPYAQTLDSIINANNDCAETVFYMTWGRENGDASNCASWPPVCTYEGMDSLLNLRYRQMAVDNDALLSPVGQVWRYLRENHPEINLYTGDGSHPSAAGSYTAALSFYTVMFRKDPATIPFNHTLTAEDAATIKSAVQTVVYDNLLEWHVGEYDLSADFSVTLVDGITYSFVSEASNALSQYWSMNGSTEATTTYTFPATGTYEVELYTSNGCDSLSSIQVVEVMDSTTGLAEFELNLNNPVRGVLSLPAALDGYSLSILNYNGQVVQEVGRGHGRTFQLNALPTGIYILKGTNSNGGILIDTFFKD